MKDALWNFQHTTVYLDPDEDNIERHKGKDILCLAHLIGKRTLPVSASVKDAMDYWESLRGQDCSECPHYTDCALCMVNK